MRCSNDEFFSDFKKIEQGQSIFFCGGGGVLPPPPLHRRPHANNVHLWKPYHLVFKIIHKYVIILWAQFYSHYSKIIYIVIKIVILWTCCFKITSSLSYFLSWKQIFISYFQCKKLKSLKADVIQAAFFSPSLTAFVELNCKSHVENYLSLYWIPKIWCRNGRGTW